MWAKIYFFAATAVQEEATSQRREKSKRLQNLGKFQTKVELHPESGDNKISCLQPSTRSSSLRTPIDSGKEGEAARMETISERMDQQRIGAAGTFPEIPFRPRPR